MIRKTLMSLLIVSSVAVAPVTFAEGTSSGSGMGSDSGSSTSGGSMGSESGSGTSGGSMGSDSGTMGGSTTGSSAYDRECITDAQKQTQRCMDLLREQQSGTSPGSSGSGMGTGTGSEPGMGTGTGSGSGSGSMTTP